MKKTGTPNDNKLRVVDFSRLSLKTLIFGEYKYLLLLLFWPIFGACFSALEVYRTEGYHVVYSPLDDLIPFCELFVIPYMIWFAYLVGMYAYTILFDTDAFKKYTYFVIGTYTTTLLIYIFFPTMQELRPNIAELGRSNFLTRFMADFYDFDTNTNVCPSLHVIGSVAVSVAAWHSKLFSEIGWRIAFTVMTILIILSTVFLKQHSVIDIPPALLVCAVVYPFVYSEGFKAYLKKTFCRKKKNG